MKKIAKTIITLLVSSFSLVVFSIILNVWFNAEWIDKLVESSVILLIAVLIVVAFIKPHPNQK